MEILAAAGGALISAPIEALFEKLRSSELLKFARKAKLFAELKNWETLLVKINTLLEDAEEKQTTDRSVKVWLDELRDLAYDIEDVLDEFSTEALKRRVTRDNSRVTSFFTGLSPTSLAFKNKMASKMKDITIRLHLITTQEQTLNFTRITRERPNKWKERPPTSSLVEESDICGRNDDKEALVQMLLSHEGSSNPISVIPIVGMGGIGKTTLAQLVYNDNNVKACFDIKVWVYVSENFDVVLLTRTILQSITSEIHEHLDFNSVQEKLKRKLSKRKFLFILDDVWDEDYLKWDMLYRPFVNGAIGSKIVITTRKNGVASMAGNAPAYRVKDLPDDECLSLLARHALGAKNFDSHLNLKDIALVMVKRCKGLPLAAKVLGGLLRNKPSPRDWESILRSKMWNLPETSSGTPLPVLKLSYNDLSSHLKRCFVYCALFPKNYEFDKDELVLLWMAEGFLQLPEGGKRMEDLGIDYFEDLVSRSFFQSSSRNPWQYVMHDLINDLAQSIGGEIYYNYENKCMGGMSNSKCEKVRHAYFWFYKDDSLKEHEVLPPMKSLRTILGFPLMVRKVDDEQFYNLLIGKKYLRVLSLMSWRIKSLPDSVGDLKHLRHLNLSFTDVERLPESVSSLFNLLTLLLRFCIHLEKLPNKIRNLINLQHLDISHTPQLQQIPSGIGMLTNLQTLSHFIVKKDRGTTIAELKNLNNLRGILSIEGLHNVTNLQEAKSANLKEKQGLEELILKWDHHYGRNDMSILQSLEPHQNLKRLTIDSYGGSELPSWVCHSSFSNLLSLNMRCCEEIEILPALHNLGHLYKLEISDCASLKYFVTNFKLPTSLKIFLIEDCRNILFLPDGLMTLDDNTNPYQSNLKDLRIIRCEKLTSFPPGRFPATLKNLEIGGCKQMKKSISEDMFCNNMALESLAIWEDDEIRVFPSTVGLQSLRDLTIRGCSALKSLPKMCLYNSALQYLRVEECQNLSSLPSQMDTHLSSLRTLLVSRCPCLVSLTQGGGLPKNLTLLKIRDCDNLSQPMAEWGLHLLSSLEFLHVKGVSSAVSDVVLFPDDDCYLLPTSLQTLVIGDFMNLKSLGLGLRKLTNLHYLSIRNCPKLRYLPKEALPTSLEKVHIWDCPPLEEQRTILPLHIL